MSDIHRLFCHGTSIHVCGRQKPRRCIVLPTHAQITRGHVRACPSPTSSSSPQRRHHLSLSERIAHLTTTTTTTNRNIANNSTGAIRALLRAHDYNRRSSRPHNSLHWHATARQDFLSRCFPSQTSRTGRWQHGCRASPHCRLLSRSLAPQPPRTWRRKRGIGTSFKCITTTTLRARCKRRRLTI